MDIEQAYIAAAAYANRRGPIMRIISRLFTPEHRRAAWAVYAFFRTADDLVDEGHTSLEQFRAWRAQAQQPLEQQTDPFVAVWIDTRTRYNIPLNYEQVLLDSLELDLTCHRYETLDELKKYCYGVAVAPFLITLSVVGFRPGVTLEQARPYVEIMGTAMQLTDIMLDIEDDFRAGRIYLPKEELAVFDLTFEDIEAGCYDERFKGFMRRFVGIVRGYYMAGWPVLDFISNTVRLALGMGFVLYRTTLDEIEARDFTEIDLRAPGWKILWLLLTKWPAIVWTKSANKYFRTT
jgi:phytoene synthase